MCSYNKIFLSSTYKELLKINKKKTAEPQGKPKNTGVCSLSLLQGIFWYYILEENEIHDEPLKIRYIWFSLQFFIGLLS